jgi:hypothetical protein
MAKSLSVNNYSPLCKGGGGGIFPKRGKSNLPMSPFFKGGFNGISLFKDKLYVNAGHALA